MCDECGYKDFFNQFLSDFSKAILAMPLGGISKPSLNNVDYSLLERLERPDDKA